jgi:hypothetical protein
VCGLVEAKSDGDVMGLLVHCSNVRYAVIQASSKQERPERLVIAYKDETCLRGLIAAPSIVGLGFASREEAMANLEGNTSGVASWRQKPRVIAMFRGTQENNVLVSGQALVKHRGIPQRVLQSALATAIVLLHSKNIVSAVFRMALGGSF